MANNKVAVVTGCSSGLGFEICEALLVEGWTVHGIDTDWCELKKEWGATFTWHNRDITGRYLPDISKVDALINCAGINRIGWLEDFSANDWDRVMDTNAKAIFLTTKRYLLALANAKGTVINIVSDAARKPMRCSAAYNASKGAALILTKQLARELFSRHGITVFSVSPNKLSDTGMSRAIDEQVMETRGWTKEEAQAYQTAGLSVGKETPPGVVADFIRFLLSSKQRHFHLNGCDIQYGD